MAQSAHDYQPGQRVPGTVYQVVRLIGAGGMGTVYDVEDTTIGKRYVLKTLHPRLPRKQLSASSAIFPASNNGATPRSICCPATS